MSEVKRYSCTVLVDASTGFTVEACTPEEAAEKAEYLAADAGANSLCHQCSNHLETGDFCGVLVYDEELGERVLDTTYSTEQITKAEARVATAERQVGELREQLVTQRNHFREQLRDAKKADVLQAKLATAMGLLLELKSRASANYDSSRCNGCADTWNKIDALLNTTSTQGKDHD